MAMKKHLTVQWSLREHLLNRRLALQKEISQLEQKLELLKAGVRMELEQLVALEDHRRQRRK